MCVHVLTHTHSHTHSFSYIRLQLLTITLLIALVKIRENLEVLSFLLFFPPKLSMKSALLRFRILLNLLQYLTLHEFVNNCLLLPRPEDKKKKKKKSTIRVDAEPVSRQFKAHDTKLTNHTFVLLQNNRK